MVKKGSLLLALLALLLRAPRPALPREVIDADGLARMQHAEFVKLVAVNDHVAVRGLLSTEAGKQSVAMVDDEEGLTALHVAAHNGAVDAAKLLLEAGADVDHNHEHEHGYAPLHWAAQQGQINMVLTLLMHAANPDAAAKNGQTPLHLAAKNSHAVVCRALLMAGAAVDAAERIQGQRYSALHHSAAKGLLAVTQTLMRYGADPRLRSAPPNGGYTPAALAKHEGQGEVVGLMRNETKRALGQRLRKLGLRRYAPLFMAQEQELTRDLAVYRNATQLEALNITDAAHVQKILRLAQAVRDALPPPPPPEEEEGQAPPAPPAADTTIAAATGSSGKQAAADGGGGGEKEDPAAGQRPRGTCDGAAAAAAEVRRCCATAASGVARARTAAGPAHPALRTPTGTHAQLTHTQFTHTRKGHAQLTLN
jgi:hypothetical protein